MRIEHTPPVAGQPVQLMLFLEEQDVSISVTVGAQSIEADRHFKCPDPPCYERLEYRLPPTAAGELLVVEGGAAGSVNVRLEAVVAAAQVVGLRERGSSGGGAATA